jgi:hypothetical protein
VRGFRPSGCVTREHGTRDIDKSILYYQHILIIIIIIIKIEHLKPFQQLYRSYCVNKMDHCQSDRSTIMHSPGIPLASACPLPLSDARTSGTSRPPLSGVSSPVASAHLYPEERHKTDNYVTRLQWLVSRRRNSTAVNAMTNVNTAESQQTGTIFLHSLGWVIVSYTRWYLQELGASKRKVAN